MSYQLDPGASLTDTVRDVALDQIDAAIASLEGAFDDLEAAVHDTRKRCKKLRALVRLVRPGLGKAYAKENAALRGIARPLSGIRDAQMLAETICGLADRAEDEAAVALLDPLRDWAAARRDAVLHEHTMVKRVGEAHAALVKVRKRAAGWDVSGPARDVLGSGIKRSYGRARRCWQDASPDDAPEPMHEWRKRVKYHWYHCRLLRRAWPEAMQVRAEALDRLGDDLGTDHDLVVLLATIRSNRCGIPPATLGAAEGLARSRSQSLRADAFALAPRLFVETPKALGRRLVGQWLAAA